MSLVGLEAGEASGGYSIQGWFAEHGLPSCKIRAITETRDGYLWLATAQGIARFDGSCFTVFTGETHPELRGGGFFAAIEAPDGTLWFGGDHGVFRWHDGRFDKVTTREGLPDNYVRSLKLTRDGTLVACTRRGFSFLRQGRFSTPEGVWRQVTGVARCYLERANGTIVLATSDGLWQISGDRLEEIPDPLPRRRDDFAALLETPDGSLWIGHSGGVRRIGPDGKREDYGPNQGLADPHVSELKTDREGNIWIGTVSGGLFRLDHGRIKTITRGQEFGVTPIRQLHQDREGSFWVATATGLYRLKDSICEQIGTEQGLAQTSVYPVLETHDGTWWIGLWSGGAYRYVNGRAAPLAVTNAPAIDEVLAFAEEPAGTVWIGAMGGLYRYADGSTTNLYDPGQAAAWRQQMAQRPGTSLPGLAHRRVNSIAPDGSGGIWVATDGALYQGRPGAFRTYTSTNGPPGNLFKSVIRARNGDVWVTAPPTGVARLQAGRWTSYLCGQEISPIAPRAVYEDAAGTIWVTTEGGGLNRFKDSRWRTFTTRDGLAHNFISGITEDAAGNFWIGCPGGIMRIPRVQFDELDAGRRATLLPWMVNRSDGLPAAEFNHVGSPGAWRTRDGRLLFPTDRGVAVIQPERLRINRLAPPIHIERFLINGRDATLPGPLVVPPGNNDIQIHYTAISLQAAENVRFKIRLEPLDRDWVDTGGHREVRYAKLPPGNYTFHITACNSDGVWNKSGTGLAFLIDRAFYETAWFAGLVVLVVGGGGFWVYRAHARRAQRRLTQLEGLVRARTGELQSAKEAAEAAVVVKNEVIAALEQARVEREALSRQLIESSRQAGKAEVATSVLHNVGNVLNSVNISASLLVDRIKKSESVNVGKVATLLREHASTLGEFLTRDPKGQHLPAFMDILGKQLDTEQSQALAELDDMRRNLEHINDIVAMQQNHAKVLGVVEKLSPIDLFEDALQMSEGPSQRHQVQIVRDYAPGVPEMTTDGHKVLQILVNLVSNSKHACDDSGLSDKRLVVRVSASEQRVRFSVTDNGVGIPAENLTRIFRHGFTTRKEGHGFGLHSCALAAKELGGNLTVHSDGPGKGATFTLDLPLHFRELRP